MSTGQTSLTLDKPRETTASAQSALAVAAKRRISDREQRRLYELEMAGRRPLISERAYRN